MDKGILWVIEIKEIDGEWEYYDHAYSRKDARELKKDYKKWPSDGAKYRIRKYVREEE